MNATNPPQPDITRTIEEILIKEIVDRLGIEIDNYEQDCIEQAVQKLVTLVNEARINELKRLLSVRHRVANSIDLECVSDRIKELTQ